MTTLGEIELYGPQAYLEAREKLRLVVDSITGDEVNSTRIAAAVSDVCRRLYVEGDHPRLVLEISEDHSGGVNLVLTFRGWSNPKQDGALNRVFENVSAELTGDGIRAVKKLSSRPVDERIISATRKIVHAKGRDQLMLEIQAQNLELERHRNQLEETVRQRTEELEEAMGVADAANKAKSAFLASMSHELRTPMNAIIGYSEMLAEDAEDEGNEDALADLNKIMASAKHLLTLINDVLDLSKVEAGKMELYTEDFDVSETLNDVTSTAMTLIEKKNNALATDYGENLGVMHSDITKTRQNLFNLISNAAKFTENGTISLYAHRETRGASDWLVFKVTDTGIGIPEEKLEEIFQEFSQADESTTRDFGGTGLGLALVKRFTEMMGGQNWAESVPGEGSTFIMELPAKVQSKAQKKSEGEKIGTEAKAP